MRDWTKRLSSDQWLNPAEGGQPDAAFILKALDLHPGDRVLDAPCGDGRVGLHLARAGCLVTGIDLQPALRSLALRDARPPVGGLRGVVNAWNVRRQASLWHGQNFYRVESDMIARSWRGSTRAHDADRYWAYLQNTGIKEYEATPGNRGVIALRRILPERAEFVLLSFWDDMDAVRRFAGAAADQAVFYPEDENFLVEFDRHVYHFEVLHGPAVFIDQ